MNADCSEGTQHFSSSSWALLFGGCTFSLSTFFFFYLLKEKKPSTKVFKVDRFEVAETGASFLLIIARLSKTLEVSSQVAAENIFLSLAPKVLQYWKFYRLI